jgi:mRNA interferase HigB
MRVVGRKLLEDFKKRHADARGQVDAWLAEAKEASWKTPHDVKESYATASILKNGVVVFNIRGNRYRLAVQIAYQTEVLKVLAIGTHKEYDSWALET